MRTLIAFILAGVFAGFLPGCGENYNNPNRPGTGTTPSTSPSTAPNRTPDAGAAGGVNNTPSTPAPSPNR